MASARLPDEGELPSFGGATGWLNSPPLTPAGLGGKVVLRAGPYPASPRWRRRIRPVGNGHPATAPAPGHTPGSIIIFVTLPGNVRYTFVGDLVWQLEGLTRRVERPWLMKLLGDNDPAGTRQNLLKMVSVMQRIPQMIVFPAHDQRPYTGMARLPNATTHGAVL